MRILIQEHYKVRHIWNFQNKELSGKNPAEEKANGKMKTLHNFPHKWKSLRRTTWNPYQEQWGIFLFFREKSLPTEIFPEKIGGQRPASDVSTVYLFSFCFHQKIKILYF